MVTTLSKLEVSGLLPKRPSNANKGTFGKVLVVAGSDKYPGAAYLTTAAAYKIGAGLVTLASNLFVREITAKKISEVTYMDLDEVVGKIRDYDALLIGPGLGQSDETSDLVWQVLSMINLPKTLIDADGLNILSKIDRWWKKVSFKGVLTPHPGEMSRLTGLSAKEIQANREKVAGDYAKKWDQVVILKGANSVIASLDDVIISPFADASLARAGTGDVLSGVIAGLMAQGLSSFDAAKVGCFIHGTAGKDITIASDLINKLPEVIKSLRSA